MDGVKLNGIGKQAVLQQRFGQVLTTILYQPGLTARQFEFLHLRAAGFKDESYARATASQWSLHFPSSPAAKAAADALYRGAK